jgi:fatty-acyl-CoA synthase
VTAFGRQHLAVYKVPRIWRFVEQFPQTASGKIQKFVLRDQSQT